MCQASEESEAEFDYNRIYYDEIANRHQKENEELDNSNFAPKNTASNGESDDVRHLRAIVHVLEMRAYRLKKNIRQKLKKVTRNQDGQK